MTDVRRELDIVEVSLVEDPANRAARVTLFKSAEAKVANKSDENSITDRLAKGFSAMVNILKGDNAVVDLSKLNEKLLKRAQALPEDMQKSLATLSDEDLSKEDGAALVLITAFEATAKAAVDKAASDKRLHDDEEDRKKKAAAEEAAKKEAAEKKAELDKANLPEAVVKTLATLEATIKAQSTELDSTKAAIAKMEDTAVEKTVRDRAAKLSHVILPEDMDAFVKDQKALGEDAREASFKRFETANAVAEQSAAFQALGRDLAGEGTAAYEKMESAAAVLMKADDSLTKEAAIAKVMDQQPELYEAYRIEKRERQN